MNVLLVSLRAAWRAGVLDALAGLGASTSEVADWDAGVRQAASAFPDVLLVDARACPPATAPAPALPFNRAGRVLVLLEAGRPSDVLAAWLEAGADDFVELPKDFERLAFRVRVAAGAARSLRGRVRTALADVLDEVVECAYVKAPDGRYVYANHAAAAVMGTAREALLGRTDVEVFGREIGAALQANDQHALATGERSEREEQVRLAGSVHTFLSRKLPLLDARGERFAVCGLSLDLSVVRPAERERAALIEREARARREVEQARQRLQALFTQAPAVICVLRGRELVYELINPLCLRLFGGRRIEELLGRRMRDVLPELDAQGYSALVDQVFATGEPFVGKELNVMFDTRGDGTLEPTFWNFVYQPLRDAAGQVESIMVFAVDVTQQVQARERIEAMSLELRQLNAELESRVRQRTVDLEAAVQELESFSYSVSHDLRAPLRAIGGFTQEVLREHPGALPPDAQRLLERVVAATRRMGHIIDALLGLARVGRLELRLQEVDLSALAEAVAASLEPAGASHRVAFHCEPGLRAWGDGRLLRIALENLLGNAWKFTSRSPGPIVTFGRAPSATGEPVYCVRDNGAGFDMAHVDHLFRPFYRLHHASEFEGTGIGLVTVQRILNRHGGRIWAESALGAGAAFYFTLGA